MRMFLRLFRKELRFLAGPAVFIFLLLYANGYSMSFINKYFPTYFFNNFMMRPENPALITRFIIRPIITIGYTSTLPYIYAVLLLYSLLAEHFTRSRYQLYMLPTRRWQHLTAKFTALLTWTMVFEFTTFFFYFFSTQIIIGFPFRVRASFEVVAYGSLFLIIHSVFLCSLVLAGYVLAVCIRRFKLIIGSATIFAGYYYMERLQPVSRQFFKIHYPQQMGLPTLRQALHCFDIFFPLIFGLAIVIPAILLYEKFSEV